MQIAGIQAVGLGFHIHKQHIGQTRGAQAQREFGWR